MVHSQNALRPCAYFHKEEVLFMRFAFPSIKQHISFCFHTLQEQVLRWMKPPTTFLVVGTLVDLTRGKAELLVENARLAATTHHLVPTDQATGAQKDGPASPGAPGEDGPDVEAGARPGPARDPSTLAPGAFPRVLEAQIQGALKKVEDFARDTQLDQGNGSQQSALGSRTYPWRVT
jgi:hypothetical protein